MSSVLTFEGGQTVDTADLQPNLQTVLECFQTAVASAQGTVNVASAYRPPRINGTPAHDIIVRRLSRYTCPGLQVIAASDYR